VHEFVAVVTHPRIFDPPSALEDALLAVESWRAVATTTFLAELDGYLEVLAATARAAKVAGPRIHDARIAALCRQHAISELWTADRDFSRFAGLVVRNPLV
jgi:predicted nucleic acid-binding protein